MGDQRRATADDLRARVLEQAQQLRQRRDGWVAREAARWASRPPIRVLLVDDHEGDAELVTEHLRGYAEVSPAYTAGVAMAWWSPGQWDAVVVDLDLGAGPSGLHLISWLRDHGCASVIVLLTAHAAPTLELAARRAGATALVAKGSWDALRAALAPARRWSRPPPSMPPTSSILPDD